MSILSRIRHQEGIDRFPHSHMGKSINAVARRRTAPVQELYGIPLISTTSQWDPVQDLYGIR